MTHFNEIKKRTPQDSSKWHAHSKCCRKYDDIIPFTIADVDFPYPKELTESLKHHIDASIFGYGVLTDDYKHSIQTWFKNRHQWTIESDWMLVSPGVMPAIANAIKAFSEPEDKVVIMTPVYQPFKSTAEGLGRKVLESELIETDGYYTINFKDFEAKASQSKLFIMCSPHNPMGRVWTQKELLEIERICTKHDVIVVSDEIHCDLILPGYKHHIYADLNDKAKNHSIICTSTSKSFNLAGLKNSNIFIPNESLRNRYVSCVESDGSGTLSTNSLGRYATTVAYNQCEAWLDDFIETIEANHDFVDNYIKTNIPVLKSLKPEGTYLHWIDFRGLGMEHDNLVSFLQEDCSLYLDDGLKFGEPGIGFMRMNLGYPKTYIEDALKRLCEGIAQI